LELKNQEANIYCYF